ncbi:hypothetical protein DLAC_07303 [Tieghemostelium lacteum]|uniref:EGF-like domain-containing protein n=1 Tax=Tieghemostelium lacteum TaxID=361077 RepID=A0A151ZC74_TIELA|nr:hypothetical protein DLAC_07303 [Tieghemostelium lacteum]|eukprot:KYQ91541.1 hypothetical protein DLAC_07303 [Tieghemostelium lacteum]
MVNSTLGSAVSIYYKSERLIYAEIRVTPYFNTNGTFELSLFEGNVQLYPLEPVLQYSCITMPYPLVNSNSGYAKWSNSGQDGYYETYLNLNLQKQIDLLLTGPNALVQYLPNDIYQCTFEQFSFQILKIRCWLSWISSNQVIPSLKIQIKDSTSSRISQFEIPSFLGNETREPVIASAVYFPHISSTNPYSDFYVLYKVSNFKNSFCSLMVSNPTTYYGKIVEGTANDKMYLFYKVFLDRFDSYQVSLATSKNYTVYFQTPIQTQTIDSQLVENIPPYEIQQPSLYMSKLNITGTQLYTFPVTITNNLFKKVLEFQYPYGLISQINGDVLTYLYQYLPQWKRTDLNAYRSYSSTPLFTTILNASIDSIKPEFKTLRFTSVGFQKIVIQIQATDAECGIFNIKVFDFIELTAKDLVNGTTTQNGTWEKFVDFQMQSTFLYGWQSLTAYDCAGNEVKYDVFNFIPPIEGYFPTFHDKYEQSLRTITTVFFTLNNVPLTGIGCKNSLFINFTNSHQEDIIRMEFQTFELNSFGYWNKELAMFQVDFELPMNLFTGEIPYNIYYRTLKYDSIYFQPSGHLYVHSDVADQMAPLITAIYPGDPHPELKLTWILTIEDKVNGFSHGFVNITGELDPNNPYTVKLAAVEPFKPVANYTVSIEIPKPCRTQFYRFTYIELVDRGGYKSVFNDLEKVRSVDPLNPPAFKYISPLMKLLSNAELWFSQFYCPYNNTDYQPPQVTWCSAWDNQVNIDTSHFERDLIINFTITDDAHPISLRHTPYCYLHAMLFDTVSTRARFLSDETTELSANLSCHFNVPYGFGYPNSIVYFSISGFSDIMLNVGSSPKGVNNTIEVNFPRWYAIIDTVYPIPPRPDGLLTIVGKNLQATESVQINYFNHTKILPAEENINNFDTIVVVKVNPLILIKDIVITFPKLSNRYNVPNYYIPPPKFDCPGAPQCGGPSNGRCTVKGCECVSPWTGLDCLSQIIVIPPIIDPSNPGTENNFNTTLPNGQTITLKTLISVVSLVELDRNGASLKEFKLVTWVYRNTTSPDTKIQEFTYQSQISNIITTNVKVTVQYYHEATTIYFANEKLDMLPSTMKYKIEVSKFNFASPLNTLRVVMNATIQTNDIKESCSVQESGDSPNSAQSEYVKLQMESNSLYGRFIKRGLIDNRVQAVSNTISSNNASVGVSTTTIGINIPHYMYSAILDPDFSVLIDTISAQDKDNSQCFSNSNSSKLTKVQIAGIVIGAILGTICIVFAAFYLFYKKRMNRISIEKFNEKINRLSLQQS